MKKICVLGLGYMGLPTASLLASAGYKVIGFDVNEKKVDAIKNREIPFDEPGLSELVLEALDSKNLSVTSSLPKADIFIIAVPTPINKEKRAELKYVVSATKMISEKLEKGNLVILESTVPPATCKKMLIPILEKYGLETSTDFYISHCPERAIPGNTLYELVNNDRIIGGIDKKSAKLTEELYKSFVKGKIFLTDTTTAETVKLMENTARDINIALSNEFAKIAEEIGINIWEAIDLANRHPRINILKPGPGVGGHCIAIDPWFLTEHSDKALIIKTARQINDDMPKHIISLAKKMLEGIKKPNISILGVAYKANIDDARETPAKHIIDIAKSLDWNVKAHDHFVKSTEFPGITDLNSCLKDSDCIILVTNHDNYTKLNPKEIKKIMRHPNLIDTRNHLDHKKWQKEGFKVILLGNGTKIQIGDTNHATSTD